MSKNAAEFQKKIMARIYKGKGIFKPLNTGWIDEHVGTLREWIANVYFYRKGDQVLMIDARYNYDRLVEKMKWLDLDPFMIHEILITHQDTDHIGAVERDSPGLFRNTVLYIGEIAETTDRKRLPVGQKVVSIMGEMGRAFDGSYAEYTLVPNNQLYPVTTDLP